RPRTGGRSSSAARRSWASTAPATGCITTAPTSSCAWSASSCTRRLRQPARRDERTPMNFLRPIDRYVRAKDLWLHLLDWGGEGRQPLLRLHGFTGHAPAWDTLSIALQPHFHVYALDQRGHGDSEPADSYNPVVSFDDISAVVEQFGLSQLLLIGLSM